MFFGQQVLVTANAYRPVSILRACALVLNLLIGILRYDGKAKYGSGARFLLNNLYSLNFPFNLLCSLVHFAMPVCTDLEVFVADF